MSYQDEAQYGGLIDRYFIIYYILFPIIMIGLIIGLALLFIVAFESVFVVEDWCDYDSCSQESVYWEINGSNCFDSNNSECQDFLRLWEVCQSHKRRVGVC